MERLDNNPLLTSSSQPTKLPVDLNLSDNASSVQDFINRNFAVLFFAFSAIGTLYLAQPALCLVGTIAGAAVQYRYGDKLDPIFNEDRRKVSLFNAALSFTGFVGSVLSYSYPGSLVQLLPMMGGYSIGSVLYTSYRSFYPIIPVTK